MRSHILCPGYAKECEKPQGLPLNQQLGHVPHAKLPFRNTWQNVQHTHIDTVGIRVNSPWSLLRLTPIIIMKGDILNSM